MSAFHRAIDSLLQLLFPERCAGCSRTGTLFCDQCRARLVPYPHTIRPLPGVDQLHIAYVYQDPLRASVHQLKYRGRKCVAAALGGLLATAAHGFAPDAQAVAPIPMHASRRAERGFNQAELLANVVAQARKACDVNNDLVRVRATSQQVHLNAAERRENMRGAFAWHGRSAPPGSIVLVDDVLTTGATMSACALVLREAGCKRVYGLALARSRPDLA